MRRETPGCFPLQRTPGQGYEKVHETSKVVLSSSDNRRERFASLDEQAPDGS